MDLSNFTGSLPLIIGVIAVLLIQFYVMRKRKPETEKTIVQSVLLDVKINQAISELIRDGRKPKKFSASNYQINKNRLDFLSQTLVASLSHAFDIIDDYNLQIRLAKKSKSTSYVDLDVRRLSGPLTESREGLEEWLMAHGGQQQGPPIKYPSIFDTLFGTGR